MFKLTKKQKKQIEELTGCTFEGYYNGMAEFVGKLDDCFICIAVNKKAINIYEPDFKEPLQYPQPISFELIKSLMVILEIK